MINSHFEDIMTDTGMSLFLGDTQGLEAVHAALRKSDERHGCRVTHAQVCIVMLQRTAFDNTSCTANLTSTVKIF